jgi:hypothetical protein
MVSQEVGAWILNWLRDLVTFAILGLLVIWIIPKPLNRWSENVRRHPLKSLAAGVFVLIVGYIGIVILFGLILALGIFFYAIQFGDLGGTLLGVGLPATGVAFSALNVFVAFISKLVVAFAFGKIVLEHIFPKALKHNIWPLLLGVIIYLLIRAIPWLGWAIGSVVTLIGLGGIWLGLKWSKTFESETAASSSEPLPTPEAESDQPQPAAPPEQAEEPVQPTELATAEGLAAPDGSEVDEQTVKLDENPDVDPQTGD